MSQARAEFARLEAQVKTLNAAMAQSVIAPGAVNPQGYSRMMNQMKTNSRVFRDAAASTGMFEAQQLKVNSATEEYTRLLEKQKISFRDWRRQVKVSNAAYREQLALRSMVVRQMPGAVGGKRVLDVMIPSEVHKDLDTFGNKMGWVREQIKSASTQMVNWGKNTQWAGRQLMVGFTLPVAAFGAATGVMAYQVDKQLTRIQKVYNTTANANSKSLSAQMAMERELAQVRTDSMQTAAQAARQYGAAATDTLEIQADLAATGLKGRELQATTNEVMRIATLGEMDHQDALNASIALQSVYNMNTQELTKSFNYMNAVENATSLQLSDFAKAIPIAAAPVKQFGGDIYELGTLLTAMREQGIEATQGANAIKAAMQRLGRPSKQVREEFTALTGASITDIFDQSDGLIDLFTRLNEVTRNLDAKTQTKVFAGLFGTYQVTRMSAMLKGMQKLEEGTGQVSAAFRLAQGDSEKWADSAEREIRRMANSASGQFKIALESIKVELAQMGEPFLEIGSAVIKQVAKIISWFNKLPDGVKNAAAASAIFMALVGPLVMLTGLAANFAGNLLKTGAAVTGLMVKFELLNKESAAARLASQLQTEGFVTQGQAVQKLTAEIEKLTLAQLAASRAAGQVAPYFAGGWNPRGAVRDSAGKWRVNGKFAKAPIVTPSSPILNGMPLAGVSNPTLLAQSALPSLSQANQQMQQTAKGSADVKNNMAGWVKPAEKVSSKTKETHGNMRGVAVAGGVAAASMATMALSSNETVDNFAQMAMYGAILGPAIYGAAAALPSIAKGLVSLGGKGLGQVVSKYRILSTNVSLIRSGTIGIGSALSGLLSPMGIWVAALAAAAGSAYLIYKHINNSADAVENATRNAKPLADILGYSYQERPAATESGPAAHLNKLKEISEEYGSVIENIQKAQTEQEKFAAAQELGIQVIDTGGSVEEAKEATALALEAAENKAKAKRIMIQFGWRLESENIGEEAARSAGRMVTEALAAADDKGFVEGFVGGLYKENFGLTDISNEAEALLKTAGERGATALAEGMESGKGSQLYVDMVTRDLKAIDEAIANSSGLQTSKLKELRREYIRQQQEAIGVRDSSKDLSEEWLNSANALDVVNTTFATITKKQRYEFLKDLADNGKASAEQLARFAELELELFGPKSQADKEKTNSLTDEWSNLLGRGKTMLSDFPVVAKAAAYAQARLNREMESFKNVGWSDAYRGAVEDTQDAIADIASENFNERMTKAMDAYRENQQARQDQLARQQEREQNRFDKRWDRRRDNVSEYYDNRIDKVNAAVEAEQKAEDIRQRIFEAEITRMQRLADMANRNIDFNVALNEGNLDEAAKIRNDMDAQEAEWALGDAADRSGRGSERRQNRLQNRIDNFEEAKDKRLEHLDEIEEAERKALERSQERTRKALDREVEANIDAQQKIWDSRKENLDKAIALFKRFVPQNEAELKRHIARVSAKYQDFNVDTRERFDNTSVKIGKMLQDNIKDAAKSIRNDIRWDGIGDKVAKDMIRGAFDLTPHQFQNWMVTGKWPKGNKDKPNAGDDPYYTDDPTHTPGGFYHTGGIAGMDKGGRKGVARTNGLHPSEVPAILQRGEGVLNRGVMSRLGVDGFNALNSGQFGVGGYGAMGMAGLMGAMLARVVSSTIGRGVVSGGMAALQREAMSGPFSAAKAGIYGSVNFSADQLKNAALIASVGKKMNMSSRDIQIGIMTAITESSLRNVDYGDRDSLGLFQQRPSQGWGSPTQVQDPTYAARKFFEALKGVPDRGSLPPWLAAQSVQRSAFADGSNYRQYWDEAQAIFAGLGRGNVAMNYAPGKGGWRRPAPRGYNWGNTHDYQVPIGTPLYAVSDGTIVESRAITSGGSPGNGLYSTPYRSYGETVVMRTASGDLFRWAHMSPGTRIGLGPVKGGTQIGRSGNTGNSTGPHVHMDVNGNYDALGWLRQHGIQLKTGGFTMTDGLANLHKEEVVVDPIRTRKLFQGIDNFANGGNNEYNITVQVMNPDANADQIVRKTMVALKRAENRKPQSRGSE